jgi:hypothetical protein
MAPRNPKCTDFCTSGRDDIKGHLPTGQADIDYMLAHLAAAEIRVEPSGAAVEFLYGLGYGYHAAADALGISHEDGFLLLTGQQPKNISS